MTIEPQAIIGAGLAGLLAAHSWPRAPLFEAETGPRQSHRALLRFRGNKVALHTGIDFKPVLVRKGIWFRNGFVAPSIQIANMYSDKVLNGALQGDRSIWSLEPVQRWIAPEDFYDRLIETCAARIQWAAPFDFSTKDRGAVISTAPLPIALDKLQLLVSHAFERQPIHISRWRVDACDVHQTVYFPDTQLGVYRASITGDLLIVESVADLLDAVSMDEVCRAFFLPAARIELLDEGEQRFGKIIPLPAAERRALLYQMTVQHKIYSLGRFATWRNILLDDVVDDIAVIRRLLRAEQYHLSMFASQTNP